MLMVKKKKITNRWEGLIHRRGRVVKLHKRVLEYYKDGGENRVSKQAAGPDGSKEGGFDLLFSEVKSPKRLSPGDPTGESQCSTDVADVVVGGDW